MAITRFQDLPSTNTPINSTNLNGNFDELGVKVGTSVDNNYRANVLHSKNLFNGNSFSNRSGNGVTTTFNNSEITFNGTTSGAGDFYTITYGFYLKAGTYTFKFSRKSGTYTANGGATAIFIKKTGGTQISAFQMGTATNNSYSYTFTLDSKTQIGIQIYANASNQAFSNLILEVQFEKGSTATTYEPYVTPSIVVDNEEIYTKGQNEEYSTAETRIGTFMGKPLYRKVFTLSNQTPTSSNTNYINISGLGIDELTLFRGILKSSTGGRYVIPFTDSSSNYNVFFVTQQQSIRGRFQLGDGGTSANLLFILEYTKTTD